MRDPLVLMTQRRRLDLLLAEQAAAIGADFRDGVRATGVSAGEAAVSVELGRRCVRGEVLLGADGANGIVACSVGLCAQAVYGEAIE
jgi:flavin-dependent dehydrogenase